MLDILIKETTGNEIKCRALLEINGKTAERETVFFGELSNSLLARAKSAGQITGITGGTLKSNAFACNAKNCDFLLLPCISEKKSLDYETAKKAKENSVAIAYFISEMTGLKQHELAFALSGMKSVLKLAGKTGVPVYFLSGTGERPWNERISFPLLAGADIGEANANAALCIEHSRGMTDA